MAQLSHPPGTRSPTERDAGRALQSAHPAATWTLRRNVNVGFGIGLLLGGDKLAELKETLRTPRRQRRYVTNVLASGRVFFPTAPVSVRSPNCWERRRTSQTNAI